MRKKMDGDSKPIDYGPWTADASCFSAQSTLKLVDAPFDVYLGVWNTFAKGTMRLGSSGFLLRKMPLHSSEPHAACGHTLRVS